MSMSMSNAATSGALVHHGDSGTPSLMQKSATSPQHNTFLPNPLELQDSQILDKVYLTHLSDDEFCDTKIIFDLVSSIILQSASQIPVTSSFKPEFTTLKLISCQMITTPSAEHCVHQTALWILQNLRFYSWDAKVLITLAAFCLEYGNYLHLNRVTPTDIVGNSLKQLNQVQTRTVPAEITELVTFIVEVFQYMKQWAAWSAEGYEPEDVPALTEALQEIPVFVYWTIASIVACTANLVVQSTNPLSKYRDRLSVIVKKLVVHLTSCKRQIDYIEDYLNRRKVFDKPRDIVDLLKALIHRNGDDGPQIFEGTISVKTGLEVFKNKHVLLFISGLDSIGDEILLLNSLHDRLLENPKESIKGFKKEDFKILWVPIVDRWDAVRKEQFKSLKSCIKFYSVEYFHKLPGHNIITDPERLDYVVGSNPIIPVFNPQGTITNENAIDLIFQWGIDAFPFRKSDGIDLDLKWKWLWDVIRKATPKLLEVKWDRYIFIYGGTNNKWIQEFKREIGNMKKDANLKRADIIIDDYQLGEDDHNRVPSFWIGVERKKQNKRHDQEVVDSDIQKIVKSLLNLKRDPQGWVILSKGKNIKLLGNGEPAYETVVEFQNWKDKVLEKEGFDIAFKEYYDIKAKDISDRQPCEVFNVDNYSSNLIASISCPNPMCGRVMDVTSVNYKCCHGGEGPNKTVPSN